MSTAQSPVASTDSIAVSSQPSGSLVIPSAGEYASTYSSGIVNEPIRGIVSDSGEDALVIVVDESVVVTTQGETPVFDLDAVIAAAKASTVPVRLVIHHDPTRDEFLYVYCLHQNLSSALDAQGAVKEVVINGDYATYDVISQLQTMWATTIVGTDTSYSADTTAADFTGMLSLCRTTFGTKFLCVITNADGTDISGRTGDAFNLVNFLSQTATNFSVAVKDSDTQPAITMQFAADNKAASIQASSSLIAAVNGIDAAFITRIKTDLSH
jgi:hypothetical protein